jgi:Mlc titration factor MtfA (ptsG expression regulator)
MVLRYLRRRRYKKRPFPAEWEAIVRDRLPFAARFTVEEHARFQAHLKLFVWEKHWIGANELEVTDEMRVTIAGAAARLSRNLDFGVYDRLTEIVIYPNHYKHPNKEHIVFGEAHTWGTVVLSWDAVTRGLSNPDDGHDTALHEFAHVLDIRDGSFDGTPPIDDDLTLRTWVRVFSSHYLAMKKGKRRVLRSYGSTNEAEFFAVATEAFFEKPIQLKQKAPELYAELAKFYRVDPAVNRIKFRSRNI